MLEEVWQSLLPSNIGLFSNPVSVSAHKQRAPGPFCGAKLFLSILPLFLPVVNLNEHPKKPLVISFRRKMRLFIRFESYELQFLIDFSKVPCTFTVVFRCKVHLILLSPPHQHHIHYIFCHSSFLWSILCICCVYSQTGLLMEIHIPDDLRNIRKRNIVQKGCIFHHNRDNRTAWNRHILRKTDIYL